MNLTQGSNRELIPAQDVSALRQANAIVVDERRQRPRWFDGRFLAARDLIREQNYFLTREADLGRAAGSGVANGLVVGEGSGPQSLVISAGHGITPAGELVLLAKNLTLNLADIPRAEQYNAKFGLARLPQPPLRSRNGLFVLALRPVEFTANPVAAYPTSITGQRTVEDGDVVEAAAVVLVPWPDDGGAGDLDARRGRAARAIFVDGAQQGLSANLLPLAMIALSNNSLAWLDATMVRRELGADRGDQPGLGFAPHTLRLAHLLQHQDHLADVVRTAGGRSFPAAAHFAALPPAGPLPPGAINPADFTQSYLPADIQVEFAIIPEDELPALVEESLALPGIDLTAAAETLQSTSVLLLAPVPRNEWRATVARLQTLTRAIQPAAANLVAARKPLEILQRLRLPRPVLQPLDQSNPSDAEWQRLAQLPSLWFVRRRNIAYRDDLAGVVQRIAGSNSINQESLSLRIQDLGLGTAFNDVMAKATPSAQAEISNLLASPKFIDSPAMTAAALGKFAAVSQVDQATALQTSAALTASQVGAGLSRMVAATAVADHPAVLTALASGSDWQTADKAAAVAGSGAIADLTAKFQASVGLATAAPTSELGVADVAGLVATNKAAAVVDTAPAQVATAEAALAAPAVAKAVAPETVVSASPKQVLAQAVSDLDTTVILKPAAPLAASPAALGKINLTDVSGKLP